MGEFKHGHAARTNGKQVYSPEYRAWRAMKNRCLNPHQARFKDYGERGITVDKSWISSFETFLHDVGAKPSPDHTLDRIDNNRGYERGNVRWADRISQARNSRTTRWVIIHGQRISFAEACVCFGAVSTGTARMRVHRGWPDVAAIVTPRGHSKTRAADKLTVVLP